MYIQDRPAPTEAVITTTIIYLPKPCSKDDASTSMRFLLTYETKQLYGHHKTKPKGRSWIQSVLESEIFTIYRKQNSRQNYVPNNERADAHMMQGSQVTYKSHCWNPSVDTLSLQAVDDCCQLKSTMSIASISACLVALYSITTMCQNGQMVRGS